MDSNGILFFLLALMLKVQGVLSGSSCYERQYNYFYSNYYYTYYDYCSYGCCGYTTNRYCCSYYDTYDVYTSVSVSIGVIIGSVIGGILFLGILISVIVCCICKCADGRRPTRGTVVAPATTTPGVSIVNSHVNVPPQQYYPMYSQPVAPPSYNNTQGLNPGYLPTAPPPNYPPPPANAPPPAYPPPAYPPPPVEQPDNTSSFAPTTSGSAWNAAPPTATQAGRK
ncbi:cysteine and tyrosine-rich protein 1-like [Argopecten irradians]|uniref:cysteine and tyrosine-rich protein 1-like n=1 Tax=Argopecten irradians TaxID=31199 RepID=UPI003724529B